MKMSIQMKKEDMMQILKEKLTIDKTRKNTLGEVFTDPELIEKMLDLFPKHIWSNPTLVWLDPACGIGNFMICVYYRLLKGLENWEKDKQKRKKHIIEKMLYMVELNRANYKIAKDIFGVKSNILCRNFLSDWVVRGRVQEISKKFPEKFQCIVGNPPFQDDYGYTKEGKRIHGGKSRLYEHIFEKANNILDRDGYLCFLTPDNIFAGNGNKGYNILLSNSVPFVSFNPNNAMYFKGIQQGICYFMMKKEKNKIQKTYIEYEENKGFKTYLKNRPVNPIQWWNVYTDMLVQRYVSNQRNKVMYNRGKSLEEYKGSKYKLIYKPDSYLYTNNKELVVGLGIKKIVLFLIGLDNPFVIDNNGSLGVGPNTFYIPFSTNRERNSMVAFLESKEYQIMAEVTRTNRQYLKIAFIEYLNLEKILGTSHKSRIATHKSRISNTKKSRNITHKSRIRNTKKSRISS